MTKPIGRRRWAIAEGYIPSGGQAAAPALISHETACVLNAGETPAQLAITIFYSDRDPVGPYAVDVPARRTRHIRFDQLTEPEPIPRDTEYASLIESDVPVVVQHSRLDSRQAELALMTTLAFAGE